MKYYYPYTSDMPDQKILYNNERELKVYFGQANAPDFTLHKNEERKNKYILCHEKILLQNRSKFWDKSGIETASFWSRFYLWEKPTKAQAYEYISLNI